MTIVRRFTPPLALLGFFCALLFVSDIQAQRTFKATLDGAQAANPAVTATGTATVFLNAAESQITVNLQFSGLSSAQTAAHIHTGARGVSGPVTIGFPNGNFSQSFAITAPQVVDMKAGSFYINIHTVNVGGGEIRGQIEPDCSPLASGLVLVSRRRQCKRSKQPEQRNA